MTIFRDSDDGFATIIDAIGMAIFAAAMIALVIGMLFVTGD